MTDEELRVLAEQVLAYVDELRAENAKLRTQVEFLALVVKQGPLPTTVLCAASSVQDDCDGCAKLRAERDEALAAAYGSYK